MAERDLNGRSSRLGVELAPLRSDGILRSVTGGATEPKGEQASSWAVLRVRRWLTDLSPGQDRGATLIELVMVLVLIGVVAALAIDSYRTALPERRLRAATIELETLLNLARVLAMTQNATMTVKLSGASQSVSGTTVTLTGTSAAPIVVSLTKTLAGSETTVQTQALTGDIAQVTVSPGLSVPPLEPWVRYTSMGLRTGTGNQLITLTNTKGRTYSISVSAGGKVTWCMAPTCS